MSRRDEVSQRIAEIGGLDTHSPEQFHALINLAKLLALEVDGRNAVISKMLAIYKPEKRPENWKRTDMDKPEYHAWCLAVPLYAQACQIAGRKK